MSDFKLDETELVAMGTDTDATPYLFHGLIVQPRMDVYLNHAGAKAIQNVTAYRLVKGDRTTEVLVGYSETGVRLQNGPYRVFDYSGWQPHDSWKLATVDRERPWHHEIDKHPRSPINFSEYSDVRWGNCGCPYCGYINEDWWECTSGHDCGDSHNIECPSCEREYSLVAEIGSELKTFPVPDYACSQGAHEYVFCSQYYYGRETQECGHWNDDKPGHAVRIRHCIHCDAMEYSKSYHTMLPWLDEYDDPDYFDPEGTLKAPEDFDRNKETPVLDWLRNKAEWRYNRMTLDQALQKHDNLYGEAA